MSSKFIARDAIIKAAKLEKADIPESKSDDTDLGIDLSDHKQDYEIQSLQQTLREAQDTHALRLAYANKIFYLVCAWLVCVAIAVFLTGFSIKGFSLTEKVLITFITSTTINVVGLFVVVAKWMFPNGEKKDKN